MSSSRPELPLSVIIPAYNEADSISQLLEDLLRQTSPPKEIIGVGAGSTDQTATLAA